MPFVAVDVLSDADAFRRVRAWGVRKVPVVAKGDRFVVARDLHALADFVGVARSEYAVLPVDTLFAKWIVVLRAVTRYVRQIPPGRLQDRPVADRDRSTRVLTLHVFRIAEAFLECASSGADYVAGFDEVSPAPGTFATPDAIARFGETVVERVIGWHTRMTPDVPSRTVQTFYGTQSIHQLLERVTWHSAHHARQLMRLVERYGLEPDGPLTADDLAGLPLPAGVLE